MRNTKFRLIEQNKLKSVVLFLAMTVIHFTGIVPHATAQNSVTFQVNLKPQLEDSVFIPDRDRIYLTGDIFPLSERRKVYLTDEAPIDSVYEATVRFTSSAVGETLNYNFFISLPDEVLEEQMSRQTKLESGKRELDALYFNSFAW